MESVSHSRASGTVDAGELGLAAHLDAAATAHAGAVDHDGVEAGDDRDVVLVAGEGGELHHRHGANAEGVVDGVGLAQARERQGLAMIGMLCSWQVREENFIIGTGPTQKAWSMESVSHRRASGRVTTPFSPMEPGANAEGVVDGVGLAQARERQGHNALLAHGAVVGGDEQAGERQRVELLMQDEEVLGAGAHDHVDVLALLAEHARHGVGDGEAHAAQRVELLMQDEEVLGAGAHDHVDVLALLAEHARHGVGDGEAHAAADDGYGVALDLGGLAQRAGDVADEVALVELGEALRGLAHHHEDELDPALLRVPVGEGERHALARLVDAHHEELAGVSLLGHPRWRR